MNINDFNNGLDDYIARLKQIKVDEGLEKARQGIFGLLFGKKVKEERKNPKLDLLSKQINEHLGKFDKIKGELEGQDIISQGLFLKKIIDLKEEVSKKIENKHLITALKEIEKSIFKNLDSSQKEIASQLHSQILNLNRVISEIGRSVDQNQGIITESQKQQLEEALLELKELKNQLIKYLAAPIINQKPLEENLSELRGLISVVENRLEGEAITSQLLKVESAAGMIIGEAVHIRQKLAQLRTEIENKLSTRESFEEVGKNTSDRIRDLIRNLYAEGIEKLKEEGKIPPCPYALVFFGSLARRESGPYPDVDHLLLVKEKTPETIKYFKRLNQYVADRIYRLGETRSLGKAGLRFCEGGMNPIYQNYFFRYAVDPEGEIERLQDEINSNQGKIERIQKELHALRVSHSGDPKVQDLEYLLKEAVSENKQLKIQLNFLQSQGKVQMGTELLIEQPAEFAKWHEPGLKHKTDALTEHITGQIDMDGLENFGDFNLFEEFLNEVEAILNKPDPFGRQISQREVAVKKRLTDALKWITDTSIIAKGQLEKSVDVKYGLYRFPQVVIANLAILYQIKATNTFERIRELKKLRVLDATFADRLMEAMDLTLKLRMKTQMAYGEEFEIFSTESSLATIEKEKAELEKYVNELEKIHNESEAALEKLNLKKKELEQEAKSGNIMAEYELDTIEQEIFVLEGHLKLSELKLKEMQKELSNYLKIIKNKSKHPIVSSEEQELLKKEVLPVFNWLYQLTQLSVLKGFDPTSFAKPMPKIKAVT